MSEVKKLISSYMLRRLNGLIRGVQEGRSKAELANLRKGIGRIPGDIPELWGLVLQDLPEELLSKSGEPTKAEWAVYTAITMFALHQQSKNVPMHKEKESLGKAIGALIESEDDRERVGRRFNTFASSTDMEEAVYHLRGLIQLLRAKSIPLDYATLACDLYDYQWSEESRARVRLRWGQDFYRRNHVNNNNDEDEGDKNDEK
jgi:CRISPR system Cascade subunit CasB